jgi:hypothetical protein
MGDLNHFLKSLAIPADPADRHPVLWDLTQADVSLVFGSHVREFFGGLDTLVNGNLSGTYHAILAPMPLSFGIARMCQMRAAEIGIILNVHQTREDALHWLGAIIARTQTRDRADPGPASPE